MKKTAIVVLAAAAACAAWAAPRRMSILGDSYSTFLGCVQPEGNEVWYFPGDAPEKTDVTAPELTWWSIFARDNGYEIERNNSWSGATISNRGYNGEDYSHRSFTNRMSDLGNPDLIVVFGATNDFWAGVPLMPETAVAPQPHAFYTFVPAMDYLLQQLPVLYPEAEVVFVLNDEITGPMREAIIAQCGARGVRCLQLQGIEKRMGHPDAAGMRAIASQLGEFLRGSNSR